MVHSMQQVMISFAQEDTTIEAGAIALIPVGVKAYMKGDEVLYLYDRSSNPKKKGIVLINSLNAVNQFHLLPPLVSS